MPTRTFDFTNDAGDRLSGRLELPAGPARAWALFAHCFTCGKDSLAAVRISRRLAAAGIGVLRFDFTGLGKSEGSFEHSSFSLNVQDLVAAAHAMAMADLPPTLLVGHSLGGAAVLAAANALTEIRAVATIGAPFDVGHVLGQFNPDAIAEIEANGSAQIRLGGRPFTVGRALIRDLLHHDQGARIRTLKRPLLLLHSPADQVVGIDNVTRIYLAAHHPKSFISLDGADHLLTTSRDAEFAADMIASWSSRYLPEMAQTAPGAFDAEAEETRLGKFQLSVRAAGANFLADEPVSVGGLGSGPTPYNLLSAALAACTTMTLRLYGSSKDWPISRIRTAVSHRKENGETRADLFSRHIVVEGDLNEEQRAQLLAVAERCPVHRTLERGARFEAATIEAGDPVIRPDEPPTSKEDRSQEALEEAAVRRA